MSDELYRRGLAARIEVLGAEHVEASLARASEFSRPIQDFVTEFCWGAIWARPGLERRERSLINIAMMTALNRSHELRVHVRGALRNGVTPEEIQEVLLQAAVYCGVPASMEAFRVADEAIATFEPDEDSTAGVAAPGSDGTPAAVEE